MPGRLLLAFTFTVTMATGAASSAQTVAGSEATASRAGVRVGYGGHGLDWETSLDSALLGGRVRLRAGVGHGRWGDRFGSRPPLGDDPAVTRVAGSVLFVHAPALEGNVRVYYGVGISAYVPRAGGLHVQRGLRLTFGVEGFGGGWTVGPEFEADLPVERQHEGHVHLLPTTRVGVAIRRRF